MGQTAACVCCCEACYGCNPCSPERYTLRIHIARARDLPPKPEPPKKAPKLDEVKSKENDSDNEKEQEDSDKHEYDRKDNNDNDQKTTDNNNNNNNNNNTDQKQDEKKDEPPPPKENVYVRVKYGNYLSRCTSRKKDDNLNPQWSEILEFDGARILENSKNKNKNNNNLEISIHRGNEILLKKEILYEQLPIEYNVIKEYILCQKKDAKYVSAESERNEKEARTIVEVRNLNNFLNNNNNNNNAANNGAGFLGLVAAAPAANNNNNNNRRVVAPTAQEIEDAVNRELLTKKIRDTRLSLKIEFRHVNFAPQLEN